MFEAEANRITEPSGEDEPVELTLIFSSTIEHSNKKKIQLWVLKFEFCNVFLPCVFS
jgi:hypothetical protein